MLKRDDDEHPVPPSLRDRFKDIALAFVSGDFQLASHNVEGVSPIDADMARFIAEQVSGYGDDLVTLDDRVWDRSIYRWMDGHWEFVVDLTTAQEPVSDLALHARLADGRDALLEVRSVHVP